MSKSITVSASDANRSFSRLLRAASEGTRIVITSHGKPVATLAAITTDDPEREQRLAALAELEKHWATVEPVVIGPWTREELYDRDRH